MNFLKTELGQTVKKTATWWVVDNYLKNLKIEPFNLQKALAINAANEYFLAGKIQPYLQNKIPGGFKYGEELAINIAGQLVGGLGYDYLLENEKFTLNLKERVKTALVNQSICLMSNKFFDIK